MIMTTDSRNTANKLYKFQNIFVEGVYERPNSFISL